MAVPDLGSRQRVCCLLEQGFPRHPSSRAFHRSSLLLPPDRWWSWLLDGGPQLSIFLTVLRPFADLFYVLHMVMKFRTAFVAPNSRIVGRGDLVMDPRQIAMRYLKSDFVIDLAATIPLPQGPDKKILCQLSMLKRKMSQGRKDYLGNDLRDKLDRRQLSPRYSPAHDARGRQTIREYSPPRSPEKRSDRRHKRKQVISGQSDISGSVKVFDRINDQVKEGKMLSSGSRNTVEDQAGR